MAPALFVSIRINSTIPVVKRPAPPTLAISFGAAEVPLGGSTPLTFKVTNPNPQDVLTGIAVADALPPGLAVSTPNGLSGACGGGTIAAAPGAGSISLTGAGLFMNETCTFSVNVTGVTAGFKNDSATVTSAETAPGKTALASLKVGLPAPFLSFASDPGDVVGQGQTFTLTAADGSLNVTGSPSGGAFAHFNTPGYSTWWDLAFVPPSGAPFAPGIYEGAAGWQFQASTRPSLSVSGNGRGCYGITGRFVVLEVQYGPANELQVLALDYEQHCGGAAPALFGSVRYNSLLPVGPRVSVAPVIAYEGDGEPKSLAFTISLSTRAAGPVSVDYATADGSAKAGTDYVATSGTATFAAGQTVALVDVPLLGNTLAQPDRSFKVALSNAVGAPLVFGEAAGTILDDDAARTLLDLASDPGDFVGGGQALTFTPLDGTFTSVSAPGYVSVTFQGSSYWFLTFAAPAGTPLLPGVYEGATRYPFQLPTAPGLSVYGGGCNMLTGRFVVLEADIGPGGDVRKLAIDFEQHCEGAEPALLGSIRINSLLSTAPRLSVAPATAYEGNGEPKSLGFRISLSRRSATGISFDYATADGSAKAGTDYVATAGNASLAAGQTSTRVDVPILGNRISQPNRGLAFSLSNAGAPVAFGQAAGEIRDDDSVRTLLYLASEPGDPVGTGGTMTLTDLDGVFTAAGLPEFDTQVTFTGSDRWSLKFAPPTGTILSPGAYEGAARFPLQVPSTPGLDVSGAGHYCGAVSGRFVVLEARFGTSGQIDALAIDFEQRCDGAGPALFGSIRYNSAVPVVPHAAAAGTFMLSPCRVIDTRRAGVPLQPSTDRTFATAGTCGIPPTATALVANITVTNATQPGSLTVYRADSARPLASSISFPAGRTRANNALIGVSSDGTGSIKAFPESTGTVDFILDVSGYFQ